ncbi:MAG: acyl-homoserine-lactone synthase [Sphingomonas sp.]
MFAARKQVFIDLLKWDLPVLADTYEVDQFDDDQAEYLILLDDRGRHRASARVLRTDRPHLLGDLFPQLCDGPVPTGPTIREITRFCLDRHQTASERRAARNQLVTALAQHALRTGITDYTGVAELSWLTQILRFGWQCLPLGRIERDGPRTLAALHIHIDDRTIPGLRRTRVYEPLTLRLVGMAGGVA